MCFNNTLNRNYNNDNYDDDYDYNYNNNNNNNNTDITLSICTGLSNSLTIHEHTAGTVTVVLSTTK